MKSYWGERDPDGTVRAYVEQDGRRRPLRPLAGTSVTSFESRDGGVGADILARSILGDYFGHPPDPILCQAFRRRFLEVRARLQPWIISDVEIAAWLAIVRALRPDDIAGAAPSHHDRPDGVSRSCRRA